MNEMNVLVISNVIQISILVIYIYLFIGCIVFMSYLIVSFLCRFLYRYFYMAKFYSINMIQLNPQENNVILCFICLLPIQHFRIFRCPSHQGCHIKMHGSCFFQYIRYHLECPVCHRSFECPCFKFKYEND